MEFQRRHLEVLLAIADAGSMHKAARQLGVTQPAISRSLAEMERTLGARLFDRTASGSVLNRHGEILARQARGLMRGMRRIDQIAQLQPAALYLGCIPRAMHTLMPIVIRRMKRRKVAAFKLKVVEDSSTALLDQIRHSTLDLAVVRHAGGVEGVGPQISADRLYDERPLVVAGSEHPIAKERRVELGDLMAQDWVLPATGTTSRVAFDSHCRQAGLEAVQPLIETRSFESSAALVARTALLGLIPESIARKYAAARLLSIVGLEPALPTMAVLLTFETVNASDPLLGEFRAMVLESAVSIRSARH